MSNGAITEEKRAFYEVMADPRNSYVTYGKVVADGQIIQYDPYAITDQMQATILSYIADPPVDEEGYSRWLVNLKYRQGGSSTTGANGYYCKAQYTPGWTHITMADNAERADYLFDRVMLNHDYWPDDLKEAQVNVQQRRMLEWEHGSRMLVLSGQGAGAGIGRSPSSLLASELPLWKDAAGQFNYLFPSMMNRRSAQMILESTPFPLDEPSAEWWKDICYKARRGEGRFIYSFFPFWDGKLNRRKWPKGQPMTLEEQRLMDMYYARGLRHENLAFRRAIMDTDAEIARNPELFGVFYPFDDMTCWIASEISVIKPHHLRNHMTNLTPFDDRQGWMQYANPREDAIYVIGADPAGYGANDHASFHVLEIWNGEWEQVFTYSAQVDPPEFEDLLMEAGHKFNRALIAFERNGVGTSTATSLLRAKYPRVYVDRNKKPGIYKTDESAWLSTLLDSLMNNLILHDEDTVRQLSMYRRDRTIRQSEKSILLKNKKGNRRDKHHWDKVSALMVACEAAKTVPQHTKPRPEANRDVIVPYTGYTLQDIERLAAAQKRDKRLKSKGNRARKYTRKRR